MMMKLFWMSSFARITQQPELLQSVVISHLPGELWQIISHYDRHLEDATTTLMTNDDILWLLQTRQKLTIASRK